MIVSTEVDVSGNLGGERVIFYRCQDSTGKWHTYGPVRTKDDAFDIEGQKVVAEAKTAELLAKLEFEAVIE